MVSKLNKTNIVTMNSLPQWSEQWHRATFLCVLMRFSLFCCVSIYKCETLVSNPNIQILVRCVQGALLMNAEHRSTFFWSNHVSKKRSQLRYYLFGPLQLQNYPMFFRTFISFPLRVHVTTCGELEKTHSRIISSSSWTVTSVSGRTTEHFRTETRSCKNCNSSTLMSI